LLALLAGHGKPRSGNGGSSEQLPAVPASFGQGWKGMDFRFKADEHAESRFNVSRSMYFLDSLKLLCRSRLVTSQNTLELIMNSKHGSNITIQRMRLSTVQVTILLNI
jgi:hypothetical protein